MPVPCRTWIRRLLGVLAACAMIVPAVAEDWLPIAPDQLAMSSEPKAPAAPAIYLYRQIDRDDNGPEETDYARIKILTEEGRKYADIEIPFDKARESIHSIQARTIRPDGSIVKFDGTVYEKPIIQSRGVKLLAKTFTMPDVQVGSIIEYRYRHDLSYGYVFDSHWILNQDLFTSYAKFSLDPYRGFTLNYSWPAGLPAGTNPPKQEHGRLRLETRDVPAFVTEEYMPPENELKSRVDFVYDAESNNENDPTVFWKKFGKQRFGKVDDFVDKRRIMEQAVAQIVEPGDSPELKLRKIYARTQQIRNLSFERAMSAQEVQREKQKDAKNVEDVWRRGYGDGLQITWLFLGLVRAAGIQADPVLVSTRDMYFFRSRLMNPAQLNSNLVLVNLGGKELYLDPGTPFAPFGVLPWNETAVKGLRLDKGGGSWIDTPLPPPADSRILRKAKLQLTSSGTLEGKITITYTGLEALWRRLEEHNEDDTDRKQFLEDQVKADVPSGIEVSLTNTPDWNSSDPTLVAEYDLKVPGWAAAAGQRALMTVGLFGGSQKHTFEHAVRIHPLYFSFPHQSEDDVTIDLPAGWQVSSVPQARSTDLKVVNYKVAVEKVSGSLHLTRELSVKLLVLESKFYDSLREFFQTVRTGDEEQIVISRSKAPAQH
jgi:hypothetical protein